MSLLLTFPRLALRILGTSFCVLALRTDAGTLTVGATRVADTPEIVAYNLGHFFPGSNTHDWWRYAGVNGARIFISPAEIEPSDDISPRGDGVTSQSSFLTRRNALRADPLNGAYINWPAFEGRYANEDLAGSNHIKVNHALGRLRALGIDIMAQITGGESNLPIADGSDWAGKWEYWQHYYAQAFYLARNFNVRRYQIYNEPNHSSANGLTSANWLMRLQLASDAIQSAVADVNSSYGKSLVPRILAPVTAGASSAYSEWGSLAVENRHANFLGVTDPGFLAFHVYDYHQYNSEPAGFGTELNSLKSRIAADMPGETPFPMSISEFNVHTGATFDSMSETLDDPSEFPRFGSIVVNLVQNGEKELYCFKFGQTPGTSAYTYPVAKNGMHYVDNSNAPYNYGGITKAGEVWRLFCKGFAAGRDLNTYTAGSGLEDLDILAGYDPETGRYYIFSVNNSANGVSLGVNCVAWNIPQPNRIIIEEVSGANSGSVVLRTEVAGGQIAARTQPAASVWLYTIPGKAQHATAPGSPTLTVDASEDATVKDAANKNTTYGAATTLLARNDPVNSADRSAAFIRFRLPVIYKPDIQLGVLAVQASTVTMSSIVQAHVYGLDNDGWSQGSVTWSNAPNLKQNVTAGNQIRHNVVVGGGDSAHIQGQLIVGSTTPAERQIDVTDFLRRQPDSAASFLVVQDARWDVALPSLASGDTQPDALQILSVEGGTASNPGPRLRIVRLKDSDNDGISDEAETNVFKTSINDADTDDDGLTDGEESLTYGSNPTIADSDGDQASDRDETIAGTNPNDPASSFRITRFVRTSSAVTLEWPGVAGKTYSVERTPALSPAAWQAIGSVAGSNATQSFTDAAPPRDAASYRLRVQ